MFYLKSQDDQEKMTIGWFIWAIINSVSQICIKSEFQNEPPSNLFSIGPLWSVYKAFFENPMFSPSSGFLIVLHPPSGDVLRWTPPCHTSKVASWHVDWGYKPHFLSSLSKILNYSWKTCKMSSFVQYSQILPVLGL